MKIDITKIEGYENLSIEEKLKALEGYEFDTTGYVSKATFDKASSDLASYKKKYKDMLSAEEQSKIEREEALAKMQDELKALKEEKQMSEMTAQYLDLGYESELAKSTAKAFMKGDMATVFANQKTHQANVEKMVKAELLKGTPTPSKGSEGTNVMTKEKLKAMSVAERFAFAESHPDEYKAIYEGN